MQTSKSILLKLFTDYYLSAARAREAGEPIVWASAFAPVEILRAMNLVTLYPESYAVVCSASGKAPLMIRDSRMAAFSQDLCSYSLIAFGMEYADKLPYGGIPMPDLLVASNNQCGTILLWFRLLADKLKIPLFVLDYPDAADGPALQTYLLRQQQSLVEFLRVHTGRSLDVQKLSESVDHSRRASRLWCQLHELNRTDPPSLDAAKLVDALFPMVVARGTQEACGYYEALLEEARAAAPAGDAAKPIRLLWHGYPLWHLPTRFPKCFDEHFRIVLNDYTLWWNLDYPEGVDPWQALAAACADTGLNRPLKKKLATTLKLVDDYIVDGVILHANRSCRRSLADIGPLRDKLGEKKIPSVLIESDMADPAAYSAEQVRLRLDSFREVLEAR